jgi:hypothetical protein
MRNLLIACSLFFSAHAFAAKATDSVKSIEISQDKAVERHYYNFGMQRVGMPVFVTYRVTNTGSTPIFFQNARIGGIGFSANHNCTGVLVPSQRCSFRIQYAAPFEGYHSGQFVMSFDQGSDIVVSLSGQAVR